MPDTGETQGQEPTNTDSTTSTETGTPAATTDRWEGIPDEWAWTKGAVESANREAAARRVALRELEEQTKDAKSPEDYAEAVKTFNTKQTELETALARERAARKHSLADDVLEFLTGTTEEQIEAQATKLAALKPASQETVVPKVVTVPAPTGGVTPTVQPTELDGRAAWKAYKDRR
jgi:hypothetical protein